jgi:hypothetical protein
MAGSSGVWPSPDPYLPSRSACPITPGLHLSRTYPTDTSGTGATFSSGRQPGGVNSGATSKFGFEVIEWRSVFGAA